MNEYSLAVHVEGCRGSVLRSVRGAVRASSDFGFNAILPQVIYHCQQDPVYEVLGSSYRFTRASEVGSCGVQRMTGHLFFGSKRRPGASVSRMNQRGRSSLATHPAVFSNFLNGADPAAQARQLSRAHGCTYMASLLKVLPAVRCYHVKVTYCHFEN